MYNSHGNFTSSPALHDVSTSQCDNTSYNSAFRLRMILTDEQLWTLLDATSTTVNVHINVIYTPLKSIFNGLQFHR